jgi:beta-hydroxylase
MADSSLKAVYDKTDYPFLAELERHWEVFRDECLAIQDKFVRWPAHGYVNGEWSIFHMLEEPDGKPREAALKLCPRSTELALTIVPRPGTAGFFRLGPQTHLRAHADKKPNVLRLHLALVVPDGDIGFRVRDHSLRWTAGKTFAFPDSFEHTAWNMTEEPRYVFLCDFYV